MSRNELLNGFALFWIALLSFLYILTLVIALNYRVSSATFLSSAPLNDKLILFFSLLGGIFTALSPLDTAITLLSALLVGINIFLMAKTLSLLHKDGKVKLSVGSATLVSLISTGCSSCGFSILSLLGLGTSLSFLPFKGMEIHMLSVVFLAFSAWYMLKKIRDNVYCKIR